MPTYEVESDDLLAVAQQLGIQSAQCDQTRDGVQQATTTMATGMRAGAAAAGAGVTALLAQLSSVVATATASATAADWLGPDAYRFRETNVDLAALIARSQQQVGTAFADHQAATDQVAQALEAMLTDFVAAASRAGQLGSQLSSAVQTEASQYEAAFAGGLAAAAVGVGVTASATGTVAPSGVGPLGGLGRPFSLTPDESRSVARDGVAGILQAGDNVPGLGKDRLNSPFEDQLLDRWLGGAGGTYELTPAELGTVASTPIVQRVGAAIVNHETPTNDRGDRIEIREVTLANGQRGYAAATDFYDPLPGDQVNTLDGSLGGATVYYNEHGQPVGISDRYDFTNDNVQVDLTNFAGSLVGAEDYDIRGGVTEQ